MQGRLSFLLVMLVSFVTFFFPAKFVYSADVVTQTTTTVEKQEVNPAADSEVVKKTVTTVTKTKSLSSAKKRAIVRKLNRIVKMCKASVGTNDMDLFGACIHKNVSEKHHACHTDMCNTCMEQKSCSTACAAGGQSCFTCMSDCGCIC